MGKVEAGLLYSQEHEWVMKLEDGRVRVGITDFAQHALGDIVFVELPEVGAAVAAEDSLGSVESVKSVSDIYAPVAGKVVSVNKSLEDAPQKLNEDPYGDGWIAELDIAEDEAFAGLMTAEQYVAFTSEET